MSGAARGARRDASASAASARSTARRFDVEAGLDHRADRAERRRQDDALQRASRASSAPTRARSRFDGQQIDRPAAAPDRPRRAGAAPSRHPGADADDGARQHAARGARTSPASASRDRRSPRRRPGGREREVREQAHELLALFRLDEHADDYAGTLSGGQRKLLELARALMAEPRLCCSTSRWPASTRRSRDELLDHMRELRGERGLTFLFVEHDMDVVMQASDRVIVMAEGRVIADGAPDEVRDDQRVIDAYLGTQRVSDAAARRRRARRRLRARSHILRGVSLTAGEDEIVADRSARTAPASRRSSRRSTGSSARERHRRLRRRRHHGHAPRPTHPPRPQLRPAARQRLPEPHGRRRTSRSAAALPRAASAGDAVAAVVRAVPAPARAPRQRAGTLSGGERQMVAMARALDARPRCSCSTSPRPASPRLRRRGLRRSSRSIRERGITIVMVEQNARRALALADRGYVLDIGRNAFEGTGAELLTTRRSPSSTSGR